MKSFQDTANDQVLSSSQLADVGTVVRAVGGLIIEYKRKRAVEEAVEQGQTLVPKLAALLKNDFNTEGKSLAQGFHVSEDRLFTKSDELLNHQPFHCPPVKDSEAGTHKRECLQIGQDLDQELMCAEQASLRSTLVHSYRTARDNRDWLNATAPKTVESLDKMDTAHGEIAASLKAPAISFASVSDFYNSVSDLIAEAKALSGK